MIRNRKHIYIVTALLPVLLRSVTAVLKCFERVCRGSQRVQPRCSTSYTKKFISVIKYSMNHKISVEER
jgi:hypothetical protein